MDHLTFTNFLRTYIHLHLTELELDRVSEHLDVLPIDDHHIHSLSDRLFYLLAEHDDASQYLANLAHISH